MPQQGEECLNNHGIRTREKLQEFHLPTAHEEYQNQFTVHRTWYFSEFISLDWKRLGSRFQNIEHSSSMPYNYNTLCPPSWRSMIRCQLGCKGKAVVENNTRRPTMPALVPNQQMHSTAPSCAKIGGIISGEFRNS